MSKGFTPDRQSFEQILFTASLVQQLRKQPMCSRPAGCDHSQRITDLAVAQLLAWLLAQVERAGSAYDHLAGLLPGSKPTPRSSPPPMKTVSVREGYPYRLTSVLPRTKAQPGK